MKLPRAPQSPLFRLALVLPAAAAVGALLYWRGPNWHAVGDAFTAVVWEWVEANRPLVEAELFAKIPSPPSDGAGPALAIASPESSASADGALVASSLLNSGRLPPCLRSPASIPTVTIGGVAAAVIAGPVTSGIVPALLSTST